jgi:hypothetical protein
MVLCGAKHTNSTLPEPGWLATYWKYGWKSENNGGAFYKTSSSRAIGLLTSAAV